MERRTEAMNDVKTVFWPIAGWCEHKTWITFMDVEDKLTTTMLRDGVHPKLPYYSVYMNALTATNIEMVSR